MSAKFQIPSSETKGHLTTNQKQHGVFVSECKLKILELHDSRSIHKELAEEYVQQGSRTGITSSLGRKTFQDTIYWQKKTLLRNL